MMISKTQSNNLYFTSRHASIRKGDDIVRKVNCEFPMFSPIYASMHWKTMGNEGSDLNYNYKIFNQKFHQKLSEIRRNEDLTPDNPFFLDSFELAKKYKLGNCRESSILTLGALFANGYYQSRKIYPSIKVDVYDKDNNPVFDTIYVCDHVAILSLIKNEQNKKKSQFVVLDGWFNCAMDYYEAQSKFKQIYYKNDIPSAINVAKQRLENKIGTLKFYLNSFLKKYRYETQFFISYHEDEIFTKEQAKENGQKIAKKYPNILLDSVK